MAIKLGEKILRDMYLGDKRISKAYLSEKLVFEADKPIFVEYIESTGTQYIDTNYIPTLDDEIIADLQHMATDSDYYGDRMFFGNQVKDSSLSCIFVEQYTPSFRWYTRFGTISSRSANATDIEKTERITITINKTRFSTSEGTSLTFSDLVELNQTPLMIFNQKSTSGANRTSKMKLWSFKVTRNGNTMMDLRPCIHPKTFEACMYDTVSHKYFYNQGEGLFIPAPRFVEYIESTGTQYIDLGLKLNQNSTAEVEYCYHTESNMDTSGRIFGARYTSNPRNSFVVGSDNGNASSETRNFAQFGDGIIRTSSNIVIGQWNTYKLSANGFYINGVVQGDFSASTFETPFTIKLFAFEQAPNSSSTSSIGCGIGRCKQLKIWNGDTIVRHFRPALDPNNVACMYDMVSGTYFYNQGTGEFIAGCIL